MNKVTFKRVNNQSLPNLYVALADNGGGFVTKVGFIYKPHDSKSDRNAWRSYIGIGDDAKFLYHTWNIDDAKDAVELAVIYPNTLGAK